MAKSPVFSKICRIMIKIFNDLFDIAWRLKGIDSEYELYYNKTKSRYEIWAGNVFQIIVPYDKLDARTLEYVCKTRIENYRKLIEEIDNNNIKIEADREAQFNEERQYKIKNLVNYLDKGKSYIPDYKEI